MGQQRGWIPCPTERHLEPRAATTPCTTQQCHLPGLHTSRNGELSTPQGNLLYSQPEGPSEVPAVPAAATLHMGKLRLRDEGGLRISRRDGTGP